MNRFLFIGLTLCLLFSVLSKTADAADSILVGTVRADKANVYGSPTGSSEVLKTLVKGEAYPVFNREKEGSKAHTHTVTTGDTLWLIADQYGVSLSDLTQVNKILGTRLYIGQNLIIPHEVVSFTIKKEDSLWEVARKYNVAINQLIEINSFDAIAGKAGTEIRIPDDFYKIQLLGGQKGWIKKSEIRVDQLSRFNLGWNYNGTREDYKEQLKIPELDVVSPKWYMLTRSESLVNVSEDIEYAGDAAKAGKQIWPLFGNRFDPELTNVILSNSEKRKKVIHTVKNSLVRTKSHGINVDFENIDPKNKEDYVLFIQELKNSLKPFGITVSVDVSRENNDPFWSGSLDRRGLGEAADYIIMMGYDEHWASSPKAGSVASIPWTREGIKLLMKEVPSHKIILGVPFYTREWITNPSGKVTSIDRTMIETENLIREKSLKKTWDPHTLQNYTAFTENGEKHEIWIEDEASMKARYNLVKEFHLRGTAAWYTGGGPKDIWNTLK